MFRRVQFECQSCGEGFVDWHDDDWERTPVFCVGCGEAILPGAAVDSDAEPKPWSGRSDDPSARALGVLKSDRDPIRDTIPGLLVAPDASEAEAPDSGRDAEELTQPSLRRGSTNAASSAPRANSDPASPQTPRRRRLAPLGALLLGFAAGVPLALFTEQPVSRVLNPAGFARAELTERLAAVSRAIDDGSLDQARQLLDRSVGAAPANDRRVATLRARLALGLVLADRPQEAHRELAAVENVKGLHPAPGDVRRIEDALFAAKPSAAAASAAAPSASSPAPASVTRPSEPVKPVVTKRELLTFARDRQRRVQLDDAQRLYQEVLRTHPTDAEARCGLAEIEVLRGGVDDAQKLFARALQDNAHYAPAWVGMADVDWLSGHAARAACRYRAVIERFPAGSYPPYIVQRVAQVAGSGASVPEAGDGAANACSD